MASFLAPLLDGRPGAGSPTLVRVRDGAVVARTIEAAFDSATRRRGLLGRDALPSGAALVIAPCNAVHTFFMRFAIDVAFVARDGSIVKVAHEVVPFRLAAAFRAHATIEFAAGTARALDLVPGDVVRLATE